MKQVYIAISECKQAHLRIDYGDDSVIHASVHSNLNSSALEYHN